MDKARPNGNLGVVRPGVDAGMEKYVSFDEEEQRIGVPSFDEQGMGVDLESVVEVCHRQTSGSSPFTNKLKLISDKFKCANLGKIYEGEFAQGEDDPICRAKINRTILTKAAIGEMGIVHHLITLFRESLGRKAEVMGAWRLRDTEDSSSMVHFDFAKTPFKIMNILIWNTPI
nr:hypothetical protein CFP56_30501 [Quercus suber]